MRHRNLRLPGYDYSQNGAYFVTICTEGRTALFGAVYGSVFTPNDAGWLIANVWDSLPERFPHITLDAFVVMPNHVHSVLFFDSTSSGSPSLSRVVGAFKSLSTVEYGRGVRERGWVPFNGRLWQAGFYEHVIRSESDLNRIRVYVEGNPAQWDNDRENVSEVAEKGRSR